MDLAQERHGFYTHNGITKSVNKWFNNSMLTTSNDLYTNRDQIQINGKKFYLDDLNDDVIKNFKESHNFKEFLEKKGIFELNQKFNTPSSGDDDQICSVIEETIENIDSFFDIFN